jgi:hypothetical protein
MTALTGRDGQQWVRNETALQVWPFKPASREALSCVCLVTNGSTPFSPSRAPRCALASFGRVPSLTACAAACCAGSGQSRSTEP